MERTIEQKKVTYDFERLMEGATKVKTSEFADCMIENMGAAVLVVGSAIGNLQLGHTCSQMFVMPTGHSASENLRSADVRNCCSE